MIKLLLADDHQSLLDGFVSIIAPISDIEVVATANNGQQVLDLMTEYAIDVILLDINMPILNGVEATKKLAGTYPNAKVIALSMHKKQSFIKRMMQYGASGYLLKDDPSSEIIKGIRAVFSGEIYFSARVREIALSFQVVQKGNQTEGVSDRELEILQLISKGLTNQEMADKLFLSPHTTETHRRNLLLKLDAKNTAELVRKGMEKGII